MKKNILLSLVTISIIINIMPSFSATVIKKEDAALFSKKSIYSDIDVKENIAGSSNGVGNGTGSLRDNDDAINKFSVVTATKNGNTYTNIWSNYKITFDDDFLAANETYDFYADGMKFDFGIYFSDYSSIAVYYTRLSKDLSVVAANFAPGAQTDDVVIAGETYKHVSKDVPYPYGIEKYDYYLRNVEGKLMVIELYWEEGHDISTKYVEEFTKAKE